jgi:hypothetical protein
MKLVTLKYERAAELERQAGLSFTWIDNSIKSIRIPIGGTFICIEVGSYDVKVVEPEPPMIFEQVEIEIKENSLTKGCTNQAIDILF